VSSASQNMIEGDAFAISPVTAFTKGIFVSLLAGACVFFSIKTYKWGNCRWRPKRIPFRQRLAALQGGARQTCHTCCAVPVAALSACHRYLQGTGVQGHLQGRPLKEPRETPPSSAVHSEGSVHTEESVHSEPRETPPSSSADGASASEITELGWLLLMIGCVICPGFNLLALCLCRRRKRADLGDGDLGGDLGDGDLGGDLGDGDLGGDLGADLGAGETVDGLEAAADGFGVDASPEVVAVAASPEVATMEREAIEREASSTPCAVNAPGKGNVMDNVYVAALRASQKHEYERGWIGDREHRARLVVAWVAHLAVRQWARQSY